MSKLLLEMEKWPEMSCDVLVVTEVKQFPTLKKSSANKDFRTCIELCKIISVDCSFVSFGVFW